MYFIKVNNSHTKKEIITLMRKEEKDFFLHLLFVSLQSRGNQGPYLAQSSIPLISSQNIISFSSGHRVSFFETKLLGFPCGSAGKESSCNVGDLGLIPEFGRSPGEGKGYPLQYSGLENSMAYIVHGVAKSRTQLSDFHVTLLVRQGISIMPMHPLNLLLGKAFLLGILSCLFHSVDKRK